MTTLVLGREKLSCIWSQMLDVDQSGGLSSMKFCQSIKNLVRAILHAHTQTSRRMALSAILPFTELALSSEQAEQSQRVLAQ